MTSVIIPVILIILAMVVAMARPKTETPPLLLTPSMYGPWSNSFFSEDEDYSVSETLFSPPGIGTTCMDSVLNITSFTPCIMAYDSFQTNYTGQGALSYTCSCIHQNWQCHQEKVKTVGRTLTNTTDIVYHIPQEIHPNTWILNTHTSFIEQRYGGWNFNKVRKPNDMIGATKNNTVVWFNNKGFHSVAAYLNSANNARLRASLNHLPQEFRSQYGISTYNEPFRSQANQVAGQSLLQHISNYFVVFIILVAVTFVPSIAIVNIIEERTKEEKLIQNLFGVSPVLYWTATFIWDMLICLIFIILVGFIFQIFQIPTYCNYLNFTATLLLMLLFCLTSLSIVYIVEKAFNEPSLAHIIIIISFIFTGLICLLIVLMLFFFWWKFPKGTNLLVNNILITFPPFALGGGLLNLATNQIEADLFVKFDDNYGHYKNPYSWDIVGLNLVVLVVQSIILFSFNICWEIYMASGKQRISVDRKTDEVFSIENLTKYYTSLGKSFKAVNDITLSVSAGECFGLIGLNGAGKSTIFKMLVGKLVQSEGRISVWCERIGYCPQVNCLADNVTVEETLKIYSTIAGEGTIFSKEINDYVIKLIRSFDLEMYKDFPCKNLSGGNKRKVCAAISMIGKPKLILMDEPTSGMDPGSRRLVWDQVKRCVEEGQSVLITSHNMAECDSLCDRVAIMVQGSIKCMGNVENLKKGLTEGYKISLQVKPQVEHEALENIMKGIGFNMEYLLSKNGWIEYRAKGSMDQILGALELVKPLVRGFNINATTFEDTFLQLIQTE